jgi:hypothetical protein
MRKNWPSRISVRCYCLLGTHSFRTEGLRIGPALTILEVEHPQPKLPIKLTPIFVFISSSQSVCVCVCVCVFSVLASNTNGLFIFIKLSKKGRKSDWFSSSPSPFVCLWTSQWWLPVGQVPNSLWQSIQVSWSPMHRNWLGLQQWEVKGRPGCFLSKRL